MLKENLESKNSQLFIMWLFATAIGWGLVIYPTLKLRDQILASWVALPDISWQLFVPSLLLGLIVGILQYVALRSILKKPINWILYSTLGYALGTPIALLLSATIVGFAFPEIYASNGNAFSFIPVDTTMFICGGITGLFQTVVLREQFASYRAKDAALWVLGSALGWGLGFFAIGYAWGAGLPLFLQSSVAGLVIGAITGGILLIQLAQTRN